MNTLSIEKLNFQKSKKKLTNLKISQLTEIPISNIDKIFSGANKNPTLETIQKIANALECTIDDFIDYKTPPTSPIYVDEETKMICQAIVKDDNLKEIFKNISSLDGTDLKMLVKLIKRLKKIAKM